MKYKIGDVVRIREIPLTVDGFVHQMAKFIGCEATIMEIKNDPELPYRINIDSEYWGWRDDFFVDPKIKEEPESSIMDLI